VHYPRAGKLHFAHIQEEDNLGDENASYRCIVSNELLRSMVQGDDQRIEPVYSTG